MKFDWDPAKHEATLAERGVGFDTAALIFSGEVVEAADVRRDYGEVRMRAIGGAEGRVFHVVYTDRGDVRRIISARLASREEREIWRAR